MVPNNTFVDNTFQELARFAKPRWSNALQRSRLKGMPQTPRYRARNAVYLISVGAFLTFAVVTLLYALGYSINLKSGIVVKNGLVVLNSTPSSAFITIDNEVRTERTNVRLKLTPGTYHLKVDRPGTQAWEKRVNLGSGEAVLEDNILLFASEPQRTVVAESGVLANILSPDSRQVAYLQRDAEGLGVWVAGTGTEAAPIRRATVPEAFATPTSFTFSDAGSTIAISTAAETVLLAASGTPNPRPVPLGGAVRFAPNSSDRLLALTNGVLQSAVAGGKTEMVEGKISAWTVTGSAVYVVQGEALFRRELARTERRSVPTPSDVILTELTTRQGSEAVFAKDAAGALYTLADDKLTRIAERVDAYNATPDGAYLAYVSSREVYIWKRGERRSTLVTRFSEPLASLEPFASGTYLLYGKGGELHGLTADGSNDHVLARGSVAAPLLTGDRRIVLLEENGRLVSQSLLPR